MINTVVIAERAKKELRKVPDHIRRKFQSWVQGVEQFGLETMRKVPGYHDEPLRGDRQGQRSIRLSRAYRGIYSIRWDGMVEFALVEEVNKHEY